MGSVLRAALVLAHLVAASAPCPAPDATAPSPAELRAYAAGALHTHGAPPAASELRAPCACGCDETPAGRLVASPLGAALVPASERLVLPRCARPLPEALRFVAAAISLPEPVPRSA